MQAISRSRMTASIAGQHLVLAAMMTSAAAMVSRARGVFMKHGPKAAKRPHQVLTGKIAERDRGPEAMDPPKAREDSYFWLRDEKREDPEVLDYVRAENQHAELRMKHTQELQDTLYKEFRGHMKETDSQVPYRHGPFFYYSRTEEGRSYPIYGRKASLDAQEQLVVDLNKLAEGHSYCSVDTVLPSPDHSLIAVSVDFQGHEVYEVRFVDMSTGKQTGEVISEIAGEVVWGADTSTIYYTKQDTEHRAYQLWRHRMGAPASEDACLFTEEDKRFELNIDSSDSGRFVLCTSHTHEASELLYIDLQGLKGAEDHARAQLRVLWPRTLGVLYNAQHHGDSWYMLRNDNGAKNFHMLKAPIGSTGEQDWQEFLPYNPDRQLDQLLCFRDHIAVYGREGGLLQLWVLCMNEEPNMARIDMPEPVYGVEPRNNRVFDTHVLRFSYSSLVSPRSMYDFDMRTQKWTLLKEQEVPGYDKSEYTCSRITAHSPHGQPPREVPMSVVYRKDLFPGGLEGARAPCMLYAYGSYGMCMEPNFSSERLSMLDRGMVYVIGHVRGGSEMGRSWYEDEGKRLSKQNTFIDLIACAQHLVDRGITTPDQLATCGRSAGGLTVGAVINMRPDLFKAVVAGVPFVDVMNTMSDETIPLTVQEYEEWGNPHVQEYYDYMLSYSPYDNIREQAYPALLATGGLWDPRVQYWEPVKWVAKLRELRTNDSLMMCKIDMSAGHFSASDRYKYLKESVFEYAFVLDQLGCTELRVAGGPRPPHSSL